MQRCTRRAHDCAEGRHCSSIRDDAGVNDDVDTLAALSRALFDAGITPYYLHLADRVRGTAHFDVPEHEAQRLVAGLTARLSGYLVPRLVREIPGAASKVTFPPLT